ncbi:MAG: hypothetical protein QM758_29030 [Armatimonas sp.]
MKPDERNKIIALVAGIMVVFGAGGFNIVRMMGGGGSPAPSPTPLANADQQLTITPSPPMAADGSPSPFTPTPGTVAQGSQEVTATPGVRTAMLNEPSPLPVNAANPFRPIGPGPGKSRTPGAPVSGQSQAGGPAPSYTAQAPRGYAAPVTRMSIAPKERDSAPTRAQQPSVSKAASRVSVARSERQYLAAIPLELVGVVENESGACALIKLHDEQVLVGVGERVSEFRVEKIEMDSVTLVHAHMKRTLRVGADGTSSSTMSPPDEGQTALLLPVETKLTKRSSLFQQGPVAACPTIPEAPERLEPFEEKL